MIRIKLLKEDELYTRTQANRNLDISTNAFYKYYIDQMEMKEDFVTGKTRLYKGSTINDVSIALNDDKRTPVYLIEEDLKMLHFDATGELIDDLRQFNASETYTDDELKELQENL
ncbi:hypothetical protein M1K003_2814 [Staphylococcus aureus]|uniref:Uncharacterized protein n=1 Tax=Staphylococcus aureus TaxID=1280 RepID=A0A9P2YZN6_STAAU|nr:hypothetical protein [Staphylococcus aureus]GBV21791.1 hypothetical protein M1K003_2814 [Staphylococcus aureus]